MNVSYLNGVANGNASTLERGQQFLMDISSQSIANVSEKSYHVMFRHKDVLAVKLTYAPKGGVNGVDDNYNNDSAPGRNPVYSRSYKVYIVMDDPLKYSV